MHKLCEKKYAILADTYTSKVSW